MKQSYKHSGLLYHLVSCTSEHQIGDNIPFKVAIYQGDYTIEVLKLRIQQEDHYIEDRLVNKKGDPIYPYSEQWGAYGWTFQTMEAAEFWRDTLIGKKPKKPEGTHFPRPPLGCDSVRRLGPITI